ncbi:MAG: LysR family transcriptional regulator [Faecalibacillus sp.]
MNTNQLECFIAVAENLNFSKASKKLHISQPAISHQINSLENELNILLFSRTNKNVELTNAGIQFMPEAIKILDIENQSKNRLQSLSINHTTPLEICCHNQLELDLVSFVLPQLKKDYPHIYPVIRYISTLTDEQIIESDIVQLTFGIKDKTHHSQIIYEELGKVPISCICSLYSPLFQKKTITIKDINETVLLSHQLKAPDTIIQMQNQIVKQLNHQQIQYCETFEVITALVKSGIGVTIRPDIKIVRDPNLKYFPLQELKNLSFGVYYKKNNQQEITKKMINILKKNLNKEKVY